MNPFELTNKLATAISALGVIKNRILTSDCSDNDKLLYIQKIIENEDIGKLLIEFNQNEQTRTENPA